MQKENVLSVITNSRNSTVRLNVRNDFSDLGLRVPESELIDSSNRFIFYHAMVLYEFLSLPLVDYPLNEDEIDDVHIENIDNRIKRRMKIRFGEEARKITEGVLNENRMRLNKVTTARSALQEIFEIQRDHEAKQEEKSCQFHAFSNIMAGMPNEIGPRPIYKRTPVETRIKIVKYLTKASEIALRVLAGENIEKSDWEILDGFKTN